MWVNLLVTHLGLWDWCTCPKSGFCCFWPCWGPPKRKPFCERLPPEAPPSLSSQIHPSASSSTWDENVYDDVEVPSPKRSTLHVWDKEGVAEVSYESIPGDEQVETITSRDKERPAPSHRMPPGADGKPNKLPTHDSPSKPEEHIYEDVDNVHKK